MFADNVTGVSSEAGGSDMRLWVPVLQRNWKKVRGS